MNTSVCNFRYHDTGELELVHKADLEERRGMLALPTMREIDAVLRRILALE